MEQLEPIHDHFGIAMDALAVFRRRGPFVELVFESRGGSTGGRPARNTQHFEAVEITLERLADIAAQITAIRIESKPFERRLDSEKEVKIPGWSYPINVGDVYDFKGFRTTIGRELAKKGESRRGTYAKKFGIEISAGGWPDEHLHGFLCLGQIPTVDDAVFEKLVLRLAEAYGALASGATPPSAPAGNKSPASKSTPAKRYLRDPKVAAWELSKAEGRCRACKKAAPFNDRSGVPFLEVHHLKFLRNGGPDTIDNVVACCPNCHQEFHHGDKSHTKKTETIRSNPHLVDHG